MMKKINSLYFTVQLNSEIVITSGTYMHHGTESEYDYVSLRLMPQIGMFGKAFHWGCFRQYNSMLFDELSHLQGSVEVIDGVTRTTYDLASIKEAVANDVIDPTVLTLGTGIAGDMEVKFCKVTFDLEGNYAVLDKNGNYTINEKTGMPVVVTTWNVYVPVIRELSKELTASGKTITKKSDWSFIIDPEVAMRDEFKNLQQLGNRDNNTNTNDEADDADESDEENAD